MTDMNAVRDLLQKTLDLVVTSEHAKNQLITRTDQGVGYCINGAVNMVLHGSPDYEYVEDRDMYVRALAQLAKHLPEERALQNVTDWYSAADALADYNNSLDTSKEDIILLFKKALADIE